MKQRNKSRVNLARKRILIVDDHPMTRYGIAQLIGQDSTLEVCGEAGGAQSGLVMAKKLLPDLMVADLSMPDKSGLELIKDMKTHCPNVPVLVVSMHEESIYAKRALRAGGVGYLMKSAGGEKLLQAIQTVLEGRTYVSEKMSARIVELMTSHRPDFGDSAVDTLSEREFVIFELFGKGLTTSEIAKNLHISAKTVATHRMHIVEKLKLTDSSELNKFAIRWARAQDMV